MDFWKNISREKINFGAACLLVFSLPFYRWISTYFIAIWIVTWLIEGNFRKKFIENKRNYLLFLPIAFYLLHVISLLYSANKPEAYFDIEVKLSFLLFPVIFLTSNKLYKEKFSVLLKVFISANLLAALICLFNAVIQSITIKNGIFSFHHDLINAGYSTGKLFLLGGTKFMYTSLSIFNHPGYFSMYINFSIAIILFFSLKNKTLKSRFFWILMLTFFSVFNYLLFSRAGIISFLLIVIIYFIYSIIESKTKVLKAIKASVLIIILSVGVLYICLNGRMQTAFKEIGNFRLDNSFIQGNNDDRLPIWYVTGLIIKDNCIAGVGTGDVKDELKLKYLEYNLTDAYSQDLNVHNQFLETFMGVGLLSFLVLLLMLFAPVIIALKRGDLLSASFFIIFIVLMLVESTFNSQAGVVFFVFFYCLIVTNLKARITCTT